MSSMRTVSAALAVLVLATNANADSYGDFVDVLEVDQHGALFANIRDVTNGVGKERVSVVVWTRLHPEAPRERLRGKPRADLSAGPIRTVFQRTFDRHPGLVRLGSTSIAILDFHASNYGSLKRGPAVRIVPFDGSREISLRLDEVFANGTEKYHNGRGLVQWLQDAWYDEDGRRLFIVSTQRDGNPRGREVAMVDLDSGRVSPAGRVAIEEQLSQVAPRHLHSALDVAVRHGVDGVDDVATRVFEDESLPLPARVRAAAHLAKLGNTKASRLIRELAALARLDPADVRHPAVSRSLVFDYDYWVSTIGYAEDVEKELRAGTAEER